MLVKWSRKLKNKFGYTDAKDCYVIKAECLDYKCFRPHDWNHDNHLVCWLNASNGCPPEGESDGKE